MPDYTVTIDEDGSVLVDDAAPRELASTFGRRFGPGRARYCAAPRPQQLAPLPPPAPPGSTGATLRVHSIYHRSLTDGPGRRSTVKLQGCSIGTAEPCPGCIVPDTHRPTGGRRVGVDAVADALTAPVGAPRDGFTLLGGEPLDQAQGVAALIAALRARKPDAHLVLYSGYTLAELLARRDPWVDRVLAAVDVLIDGRYLREHATGAGPYRGSTNQRIYGRADLAAALGHVPATPNGP